MMFRFSISFDDSNKSKTLIKLGLFVFMYTLIASYILQEWAIPKLFPHTSEEGLVLADSIGFNQRAKAKAAEISSIGWSAWELRAQSQSPAGVASIFYVLWGPSPKSILPFNAFLHAITACVVMRIFSNFFNTIPALIGALIFALNPASFEWTSQIHRDGIFILGNMLIVMAFVESLSEPKKNRDWKNKDWVIFLGSSTLGVTLIWVARIYWVQISLMILLIMFFIILLFFLWKKFHNSININRFAILFFFTVILKLWFILVHSPSQSFDMPLALIHTTESPQSAHANANESPQSGEITEKSRHEIFTWKLNNWVPEAIEARMYRIAMMRQAVNSQGGGTLVDSDYMLDSTGAIIEYLPRAFQIGLLSPLPTYWTGQGSTPAMTMARKVVGLTTLFFYFCLLGMVIGFRKMIGKPQVMILMVICLSGILIYALVYPNVGTLMRYRYGFYMLLVGYGLSYWVSLLIRCNGKSTLS